MARCRREADLIHAGVEKKSGNITGQSQTHKASFPQSVSNNVTPNSGRAATKTNEAHVSSSFAGTGRKQVPLVDDIEVLAESSLDKACRDGSIECTCISIETGKIRRFQKTFACNHERVNQA